MRTRNNGAIFRALFNKIRNIHIKWAPNLDWLSDDFDEMECVWYLREPLQLTLFCSGWVNDDECRESVYKHSIFDAADDWKLISDYIYDPVDRHFCPDEQPNPWRGY